MFGNRNANYICEKHKYSRKGYGLCPICRQELKSIGEKQRIGHLGQFDKKERKTKNLQGHIQPFSHRQIKLKRDTIRILINKKKELLKKALKLKPLVIPSEENNFGC